MMRERAIAAIGLVALLALPFILPSNYHLRLANLALVFALLAISLNIVLGYAGQVALGHAGLFGIGAYTAALLTAGRDGLLFWPAFVAAGAVTGIAGLLIGIPTLRLRGHYLALATLGFGEIMRHIFFNWREVTHGMDGISGIPAPSLYFFTIRTDRQFFYLALIVLVAATIATRRLERSKFGRMLTAIRDAELAAGTSGVDVPRLKVIAFFISAVLAGFAGSLYAHMFTYISPDVFVFDVTAQILSMVAIGGIGTTFGPILGAVVLTVLPELLRISKAYYQLIYGAGIAAMIIFLPGGLIGLLRWFRRGRDQAAVAPEPVSPEPFPAEMAATPLPQASSPSAARAVLFETQELTRRFGGLTAVDTVNLAVEAGTIHALIGPNGSGKSTLINLATGIYVPTSGRITFAGAEIAGARPWRIANHGLVRTFQNLRLFNTLSVEENVLIGCRSDAGAGWADVLLADRKARSEEADLREHAERALRFVGLWHLRDRPVRILPHEQQRLVEIARAVAQQPKMIMLDEPAAGMNPSEIERLIERIFAMRDSGITVLLVEHNIPLVMRVADRVTVLNFGHKIAEGRPADVRDNPEVIEAYLGHRLKKRLAQHADA